VKPERTSMVGEMVDDVIDWSTELWQRLRREATDRDHPRWPPMWLRTTVGVVLGGVVLFVVVPLLLALIRWAASMGGRGVDWLVTWDLFKVVTTPVRSYILGHAVGLPVDGDAVWLGWQIVGGVLLFLGWWGVRGARIAWPLFGAGTAAMVYAGTPGPARGLAVGITLVWWSLGAVFVYRTAGQLRDWLGHRWMERQLTRPAAPAGTRRVDVDSLNAGALVLADLAALMRAAARHPDCGPTADALVERARELDNYADQLSVQREPRPRHFPSWRDDLAIMLDKAPLLDATDRP
jgi:hypothetical protein